MKFAIILVGALLFLALVEPSWGTSEEWGEEEDGDILAYEQIHFKKSVTLKVQKEDVRFKSKSKITCIKVNDQKESKNAKATLKKGGVGQKDVIIRLESTRGHGFNFEIEIYVGAS